MTPVQIGMFTFYYFYGRKVDTVNSSDVNNIGQNKYAKKMNGSMIFHFSGLCSPHNLVLSFMCFINYLMVSFVDIKYNPFFRFRQVKGLLVKTL